MGKFIPTAIMSLIIVTGALCDSEGGTQAPQYKVDTRSLSVKEMPHFWQGKNGNLLRNGLSQYTAPADLTMPLWEWTVPGSNQWVGHIEATPVIDKNSNVYIGTTTGGIFALARDGTQLWVRDVCPCETWQQKRISTGFLHGNSLYIGTGAGIALSLDLATGSTNWQNKYSDTAGSDAWSVTVADGVAVFPGASEIQSSYGGNNEIVALNIADGSEKWRWMFTPGTMIYNFMPAVVDDKLIFIDMTGLMYCLSLSEGILLWKSQGSFQGFTTAGVSVGPFGLAYTNFNTQNGGVLRAYDIQTGAERWRREFGLEAAAAPVVGKLGADAPVGVVVGVGQNQGGWTPELGEGAGEIRAYDPITGADLWTFRTPSQKLHGSAGLYAVANMDSIPDTFSCAAIGGNGTIYVGWQGGKQFALEGATGKMISSHFTGWGTQGEPAIGDGFVVIASIGKMVAFATAELQESPSAPHHTHSTEEMRTVFM